MLLLSAVAPRIVLANAVAITSAIVKSRRDRVGAVMVG